MSWWDASGLTNMATQALKNAQKKIDKVLDIEEEDRAKRRKAASQKKQAEKEGKEAAAKGEEGSQGGDFWSAWGTPGSEASGEKKEGGSSWNLPWSFGGEGSSDTTSSAREASKRSPGRKVPPTTQTKETAGGDSKTGLGSESVAKSSAVSQSSGVEEKTSTSETSTEATKEKDTGNLPNRLDFNVLEDEKTDNTNPSVIGSGDVPDFIEPQKSEGDSRVSGEDSSGVSANIDSADIISGVGSAEKFDSASAKDSSRLAQVVLESSDIALEDASKENVPPDTVSTSLEQSSIETMTKEEDSETAQPSESIEIGHVKAEEGSKPSCASPTQLRDELQQSDGQGWDGWQDFSLDGPDWADSVETATPPLDIGVAADSLVGPDSVDGGSKSEEHVDQGDGTDSLSVEDKEGEGIEEPRKSQELVDTGSMEPRLSHTDFTSDLSEDVSQSLSEPVIADELQPDSEGLDKSSEHESDLPEPHLISQSVLDREEECNDNSESTDRLVHSPSDLDKDDLDITERQEHNDPPVPLDLESGKDSPSLEPRLTEDVSKDLNESISTSEESALKDQDIPISVSEDGLPNERDIPFGVSENYNMSMEPDTSPKISEGSELPEVLLLAEQEDHQSASSSDPGVLTDALFPQGDASTLRDSSSSSFTELVEDNVSESSGDAKPDGSETEHKQDGDSNNEGNDTSVFESGSAGQQKSSTDLIQEYVNISSMGSDVGQNTSLNSSGATLTGAGSEGDLGNTSRNNSDIDLPEGHTSSTGSSDTSRFDSSMDTVVDYAAVGEGDEQQQNTFSLFGQEGKDQQQLIASMDSSYVKSMLEEAMEESKTEDSGSDNHSNGEKSESSKPDSEHDKSVYSGHESSDDIETTTSSDIEIIQAPGGNGEGKYHTGFDLSPLKIALQKTAGGQGHHRSDSQSSSSAHSKEHLSPDRGEGTHWRDEDESHHDLKSVREEGQDSPYHPERLLKLAQSAVHSELQGGQKLAEMAEVLQARENKLVELSKENHQLMEDKNILYSQLQQSEENRASETADLNALTEEFTARLGEAEKKIQTILKEKESLKQQLKYAEKEIERRSGDADLEALLEEKKEQVQELLAEGEKLSKQQLQSSNIIKKLRAKEKETETTITSHKKKLDEQGKELDRLTTVLDAKEDLEKKQAEAINQLNTAVQSQDKELSKLRNDLEDAQEKNRGLQAALDSSYKEIAELHRSNASQDSKAQEAALSAETQVREELKAAMEREQQRFKQEREAFIIQADDLRLDMTRLEKEHNRREDLLRQEIAHLQQRLQEDESRSQELTQSVTSATRPLLRQIENLQATYGAQATAWERVEKSLTDRLAEAQTNLAVAQEKERAASEKTMELTARVTTLETACTRLKQEKAQLSAQLENERAKLEELQDGRQSIVAQLEASKQKMSEELNLLTVDKIHLESQLNVERTKVDNERKKALALEEQIRMAEREQRPKSSTPSPSPSMSVSRQESLSGSFYEAHSPGWNWSYHEDQESVTVGGAKSNVYESLRHSGAAIVVENLQSQLKLKEGEIVQLQSEISQLERTRESMARELVDLTYKNEELEENKQAHEQLKQTYDELNGRYSALLQMYGEKEEQVQELRLDLQDVKEMYKSQIDSLLTQ